MTKRAWIIFAVIVVAMLGGLIFVSGKDKLDVNTVNTDKILAATQQSGNIADHVFGKADSKVMIVEYGDFQCPGCGRAYPVLKTISEKYKDQVAFVFRNFPLTTLHPNARAAAAAAEAAGLQGKYWEMHNLLYESQQEWQSADAEARTSLFLGYAKDVGIDQTKFTKDVSDPNINKKITFDQALGKKLNLSGTPSIFLNGKAVDQYVKGGKFVQSNAEGANPIWSDSDSLDALLVVPALKEAGIQLPAAQ
jgi:protein-disulfide isomerase